jgi:hypothetical protein
MANNWFAGKGWGLPEFRDAQASYFTNVVANVELATVYRAGILGLVGLLIVLSTFAVHLSRHRALLGVFRIRVAIGTLIGIAAAAQLGNNMVINHSSVALVTFALSIFYVHLDYAHVEPIAEESLSMPLGRFPSGKNLTKDH